MNSNSTLRRNLSGIYIFDILPQDNGKRNPTCLEDCNEATRLTWLEGLEADAVVRTGQYLNECYDKVWEMLSEQEKAQLMQYCGGEKPFCDVDCSKPACIERINLFCKVIRLTAEWTGICAPESEAALNAE